MYICLNCKNKITTKKWHCSLCNWKPKVSNDYIVFSPKLALENTHFNSKNFKVFSKLESSHFWFRARNNLICWAIQKYYPKARNFLEIGCGTGFVLSNVEKKIPHLSVHGSDIYLTSLPYAQKRLLKNTDLFQMDARKIPFINHFDTIGAFDVLEHIEEDELVLQQMYSALKDNGKVILSVPQHPMLWSKTDIDACHVRRYRVEELEDKLKAAGFEVQLTSSFVTLLFPFMLISRVLNRKNRQIKNELKINRFLNFIFEKILNMEIKLISIGVRFPFGGSRFIVAKKKNKSS